MHSLSEWGRVKQKLCKQACKIFAFFCQSQLDGIIRAHLRNPWLVLLQPRPARGLLKTILPLAREREELRIVADQFGAPTGAAFIAYMTAQVLGQYVRRERKENFPAGVFHLTASGVTFWHGCASALFSRHAPKRSTRFRPLPIPCLPPALPTPHFAPENWKPILGSLCRTGMVG